MTTTADHRGDGRPGCDAPHARGAAGLPAELLAAPRDVGTLELVVRRPGLGEREVLDEGELDLAVGPGRRHLGRAGQQQDRRRWPHPEMQLNVMSARMVALPGGRPRRRALAGDQLYLDLDLSHENLPAGSRLTIGDPAVRGAVIEVTEPPHTGCAKFVERFGAEAMRFVNGTVGRPMRLRGLNARVVVRRPRPPRRPGHRHPPLTLHLLGDDADGPPPEGAGRLSCGVSGCWSADRVDRLGLRVELVDPDPLALRSVGSLSFRTSKPFAMSECRCSRCSSTPTTSRR